MRRSGWAWRAAACTSRSTQSMSLLLLLLMPKPLTLKNDSPRSSKAANTCILAFRVSTCDGNGTTLHTRHISGHKPQSGFAAPAVDEGGGGTCERLRGVRAIARQGKKSRHCRRIGCDTNWIGASCCSSVREIGNNHLQQAGAPSEDSSVTDTCARANDRSAASIATAVARSVSVMPNSRRDECVGRRP